MEEMNDHPLSREDKILSELMQLKRLFAVMLGTEDQPAKDKFSRAAITKAASEYRKMRAQRGEWIPSDEISKVIRHADWRSGKIIIEQFQFKNYFKRGSSYYFKKKDLVDLGKELKEKKINLEKYDELLRDKEKFQKYIDSITQPEGNKKKRRYKIPEGLENIFSVPYSPPNEELVRNEIKELWEEYEKYDLSEFVDLYYEKTYAQFKYIYHWDKYIEPQTKKLCKGWCEKYNYANQALKLILELKKEDK